MLKFTVMPMIGVPERLKLPPSYEMDKIFLIRMGFELVGHEITDLNFEIWMGRGD